MVTIKDLTKKFKTVTAVNNLSFTINDGEVIGLLGPNGAGKSTLIKLITGLLRKDSGQIKFGEYDHRSAEAKRMFSYIPEVPDIYELLSVYEHLIFIKDAYGVNASSKEIEDLLNKFDLLDKKDKLGKELSKGMKQKVSICCGLLPDPDYYFFDEPMIGLDPKAIKELKNTFLELKEKGKTIFISTHLLDSVEHICDKIMVMKEGSIIATGTIDELKRSLGESSSVSLEDIFLEVTS